MGSKNTLLALLLLLGQALFAKGDRMEHILDAKTVELNRIKVIPSKNKVFLPNKFGSEQLEETGKLKKLEGRVVLGVDFVYTSYAEVSSFDQRELNRSRLKELKEELPRLVEDPTIEWRKVVQTGASSPEEGRDYFHGFRITLRPASDRRTLKEERELIRKTLSEKGTYSESIAGCKLEKGGAGGSDPDSARKAAKEGAEGSSARSSKRDTGSPIEDYTEASAAKIAGLKARKTPFGTAPRFKEGRFEFFDHLSKQVHCPSKKSLKEQGGIEMIKASFLVAPSGVIMAPAIDKADDPCADSIKSALRRMPLWKPGKHEGKPVLTQVIVNLNFSKARPSAFIDTIKRVTFSELGHNESPFYSSSDLDTIHGESYSYPFFSAGGYDPAYIEECGVLKAMRRNEDRWDNTLIVCDVTGSMSPYITQMLIWYKELFESGKAKEKLQHITLFDDSERIYHQKVSDYMRLKGFLLNAFGGGGDVPENNVEGAIEAIKAAPEAKDIIMIADNYATPHDLDRLSELARPVHVLLCGSKGGINPDYVEFVRRTGGSLHTIEADIRDLAEMKKGERVTIEGQDFVLTRDGIERVY